MNEKVEYKISNSWFLEITDENRDLVNHWRINIIKYSTIPCKYYYIQHDGSGIGGSFGQLKTSLTILKSEYSDYEQLDTFQFKKYILNIDSEPIVENLEYLIDLFKKLNIQ